MKLIRFFCTVLIVGLITSCLPGVTIDASDPLEKSGSYRGVVGPYINFDTSTALANVEGRFYVPSTTLPANSQGLVILLPGYGSGYGAYEIYALHLASYGYIVLGMDYVQVSADTKIADHDLKALQVKEAISFALNTSDYANQIDPTKIAVMGHSLGGKLGFYAASIDSRIKTVIAMDPVNAGGPPCSLFPDNCASYPVAANPSRGAIGVVKDITASSLIFRSLPDTVNADAQFNAYYFFYGSDDAGTNGTPTNSTYIDMGSAPHASYVPLVITSFVHVMVKRNSIAWLQQEFEGVNRDSYFSPIGAKMQADIASGRVVGTETR